MNLRQCDACGKQAEAHQTMMWFRLNRSKVGYVVDPPNWHLCSWECVAAFGQQKAQRAAEIQAACGVYVVADNEPQSISQKIQDAISRMIGGGRESPPLPGAK
jgi:hypothetical protein